jgi:tetraacyldisaccharide 4'-kinase
MSSLLQPPTSPRSPWQLTYGGLLALRARYWRGRARRLPKPVLSVGNLHWGGGGKTPLTIAIAAWLRDRGLKVAILSRGYGREHTQGDPVRIVSRGEGPLLGPRLGGDEPVLMAGELPGVAVVVCGDRWQAGRHALERLDAPPDVFLLDDGFSHVRLHRDLDLLAFPAADPFAGGRLLPAGRLREPLAATRRAHAVLLTGRAPDGTALEENEGGELARVLRPFGFAGHGFVAPTEVGQARRVGGDGGVPENAPLTGKALVVSAIARPESFVRTVRAQGIEIAETLAFPDHHRYPDAACGRLRELFDQHGAAFVLTTAKDAVKLHGRLDLPLVELPIHARLEPSFQDWLGLRLGELGLG